jgi:serine/threonine protein kinase
MAPEMIAEKPPTTKVDMWALGVILYELSAGRLPFEASGKF